MTPEELCELLDKIERLLKLNGMDKYYEIKLSLDLETYRKILDAYWPVNPISERLRSNIFLGIPFTVEDNFALKIVKKEGPKLKDVERPFKDCQELIRTYSERLRYADGFDVISTVMQIPIIWVRLNVDGRRRMIVGYGDGFVEVGVKAKPVTLEHLYKSYTFLDGSICGVKEVSYE